MNKVRVKIDIIIPVYNCEQYLDRCMRSLLGQKMQDCLRFILVDDGSSDGSGDKIDWYERKYDNVEAVHKKNGGVSSARNAGLKLVENDYFSFVDPDDWVSDSYFELILEEIQSNNVDILMTPYIGKYEDKEMKNLFLGDEKLLFNKFETKNKVLRRLYGLKGSELEHPLSIDNISTVWAKVYKSKKYKKIKFVNTSEVSSEDLWFNINCFANADTSEYLNKAFYIYYKENNSSLVHTYDPNIFNEYINLYNYMKKFIISEKLSSEFFDALNNRIVLNELIMLRSIWLSNTSLYNKKLKIHNLLNKSIYRKAFARFPLKKLPLKYRFFYWACKKKNSILIMLLLPLGESLKKKIKQ